MSFWWLYRTCEVMHGSTGLACRLLVIQLKRYSFDVTAEQATRCTDTVVFPLAGLDVEAAMTRQSTASSGPRYRLTGACCHAGSLSIEHGHYYAVVLSVDGVWTRVSDETVSDELAEDDVAAQVGCEGYLLFYTQEGVL